MTGWWDIYETKSNCHLIYKKKKKKEIKTPIAIEFGTTPPPPLHRIKRSYETFPRSVSKTNRWLLIKPKQDVWMMNFTFTGVMYIKCVKISFMRMCAGCCQCEHHSLKWEHWECTNMNRQCFHFRRGLYLDAKGSGLWAGRLSGGGRLCSGLEESFEDGLGVHLWSGLRGGTLTGRPW